MSIEQLQLHVHIVQGKCTGLNTGFFQGGGGGGGRRKMLAPPG